MFAIFSTIGAFLGFIVFAVILGAICVRFYKLSTKEMSFIRTGVGGEKVVINGGAFVLPGIQDYIQVNMKTLKLQVDREGPDSLVTKDRMRVDVKVDFFVRVKADAQSISKAATTLGDITKDATKLRAQVEAKFIGALRDAASKLTMHDLQEKRTDFVQSVQVSVVEDLEKNGLELESVSLTALNQTDMKFFNPNNAFDAEGLAQLTRQTETRRKEVNAVKQETAVAIAEKDLTTTQQTLALRRTQSEAELKNAQEIASMTASQTAAVAQVEAQGRMQAANAELEANQKIAQTRIATERQVAEAEAAKKQAVETAQLSASTAIRLAEQQQAIDVADKSQKEAAAEAAAADARAKAVEAEEKVKTVQAVEIARRSKEVALVKAEELAREQATSILVAAESEQTAAKNLAEAVRLRAEGEKDAALLRAQATIAEGDAVAKALAEKIASQNKLSPELIQQEVKLALLAALPQIIAESVKPMEKIDSIRIAEVGGLTGGSSGNGEAGSAGTGSSGGLGNEIVTAGLRYRTNAPVVDALLQEIGLSSGGDLTNLVASGAQVAGLNAVTAGTAKKTSPAK